MVPGSSCHRRVVVRTLDRASSLDQRGWGTHVWNLLLFVPYPFGCTVGTLDTARGTACDNGLIPSPHLGNSAPHSAPVHRRQTSQLQGSLEVFANESITRSTKCKAEHNLLGHRADVHAP